MIHPLSANTKLRVMIRLLTTRRGKRMRVARDLAAECGCSVRALFRWRARFLKYGTFGLVRVRRSDANSSHLYTDIDVERMTAVAVSLRRHPHGKIRKEWRALKLLGLAGSYESCRATIRRLQVVGWEADIA